MKKLWIRYQNYVEEQYLGLFNDGAKDITFWRARLFMNFMLFTLPIGIVAYIPSMVMSFIADLPFVAFIDTFVLLVILLLVFNRKIKLKSKKNILAICLYVLSMVLLVFIGSMGPGLIYLLGASIFMVLIISSKAGYISIFLNFGIYCLLAIGLLLPKTEMLFFNDYTFGSWIAVGINFVLINAIAVISISALINGLQKTILNEKKLQHKLKKESKKLKKATAKAIQSDKLKSAFLENMSHEIRTPLNAIVGFANIILKQQETEKQKVYLDIINKSSEQLLSLINDIIDLSKIEAGVITLKREKIKLIDFLLMITDPMKTLCPPNIKFEYCVEPHDKAQEIVIDTQKVTQIITNLITNSYKYTKEGYVKLNVSLSADKKDIKFSIKDTGIGIPQKKQKQIFERFYQQNTMASGVGLGLSICKSLVKAMNGEIHMVSEQGKGATFFVSIPNNISNDFSLPVQTDVTTQKTEVFKRRLKVLIAEDNESNFAIMKEILKFGKHIITRAINGNEAVFYAKKERFDIVLMDLKMPIMNGLEATSQIRQFDKKTPIIAVTAYAFDSDEEKALMAGCNDYLVKPIEHNKFNQLLNKYANLSAD